MTAPVQPLQPQAVTGPPVPPKPPWTPFTPMPTDEIPEIAAMRAQKLARLIDSAKFEGYPGEWQQVVFDEFARMQQIGAQAAQNAAMMQQGPQKPQPGGPDGKPAPS